MESNNKNTPDKLKLLKSVIISFLLLMPCGSVAAYEKIVAITEIVEHPSLQQAKLGILDVLAEHGYKPGDNLQIIDKNAQNNIANSLLIAKKFAATKPDAIVAISTQSAQSVYSVVKDKDIPLVFSSVTDPVAAGLVQDLSVPVENITGAMDFPLIKEEINLIKTMLPNIKTIGFLYSSGESNSIKTIALMKEAISGEVEFIDATVANSHQVGQAVTSLIGRVDAIYIPSDNTIFSAMPKLVQMSREHKLPVFSSDPDSVKQGVLACAGYTQYAVGRTAGKLLVQVLEGNKILAITKPEKFDVFINKKSAEIMNINIPSEIIGIAPKIVE
jgi:putative tryptophan/tyrosine transport system substrate-binding protein